MKTTKQTAANPTLGGGQVQISANNSNGDHQRGSTVRE